MRTESHLESLDLGGSERLGDGCAEELVGALAGPLASLVLDKTAIGDRCGQLEWSSLVACVCVRVCVFVCVCVLARPLRASVSMCAHAFIALASACACSSCRSHARGDRGADIIARAVKTGNGNLKRLNLSGQRAGHVLSRADVDGARRHRGDEGGR